MASTYVIDGYNLLHYVPRLKDLAHVHFEAARDELADLVAGFCTASGHRARIVFDGRGRQAEQANPPHASRGVEIVYAAGHQSADAFIERMVYESGHRETFVVVSADRGILDTCQHMGAFVMRPENFLTSVREAQTLLRRDVETERRANSETALQDRLEGPSLEALKRLRDSLDR